MNPLKSSVISAACKSPIVMGSFEPTLHMLPLDEPSGQINHGPYTFSIPLGKFVLAERMWASVHRSSLWIIFLTLWP